MCLKIGLKSEAILIVSGFLAKNYFLGVVSKSGLAPR